MSDEVDLLNEFENEKRYSFFKKYWINLLGVVVDFIVIFYYNGKDENMCRYGALMALIAIAVLFNKLYEQDQKQLTNDNIPKA